jgi:hypothetical protein
MLIRTDEKAFEKGLAQALSFYLDCDLVFASYVDADSMPGVFG